MHRPHRARTSRAAPAAQRRPRRSPDRALDAVQRQNVLDLLRQPRFADLAPAEIYATLLDEGVYHCSIRTMYRILNAHQEVRERRAQLQRPVYVKPELLAEAPNTVWSWDITRLMGPAKWSYFYLYVILDIFSRTLDQAFRAHPERFVRKPPAPPPKPTAVWINPPQKKASQTSLN
jgi:putative transposase